MLNRRSFLLQGALASAGAGLLRAQSGQDGPVVRTSLGQLRGAHEGGVRVFRGVPFAEPPIGSLRFRAPQPAKSWTGVRDANKFAAAAVQPGEAGVPQSEDCLYLNVWAPESGGPYPVFVWIHGGGFTGGRSFDPLSDGTRFAREGVVCVTVAYRLGVFGFLDLGSQLDPQAASQKRPGYAGGADHALQDLLTALRWVQANVGSFGGDPHRVTVGGESAGAKLTDLLMGTPEAEPLFAQMISESGGAERWYTTAQSAEVAAGFCRQWTADTGQPATALLTADPRKIIETQQSFTRDWPAHFPLRTEVGGKILPRTPLDTIRGGSTRRKRLLIGTNEDESALFLGPHPQRPVRAGDLGNMPLAQFQEMEKRYAALYPQMPADLREIRSVTAEEYWIPSLRVAEAHVGAGGTAFVYRFDFQARGGRWKGYAFHASELDYVWDHFGVEMPSAEEQRLADTLHAAWLAFLRTGTPAAQGLPGWPAYTTNRRETMLLNTQSRVEALPADAERRLWDGLLMR